MSYQKKRLIIAIPLLPVTLILTLLVWVGRASEEILDIIHGWIVDIFP